MACQDGVLNTIAYRRAVLKQVIMSPAELKMQPTIHFQSYLGYFKYCIVLKRNYY
jgi:hypothetical protein